ncbi:hypothetical protein BJX64DRAFT_296774 [Aspergillus heterothallicus]
MTRILSSLSPELLLTILQSFTSPKDLYSAIEASAQFHRVFTAYQHSITSAILKQAIPVEIEGEFVLAYRAQEIWGHVPEGNDRPRSCVLKLDLDALKAKTASILQQALTGYPERLHSLVSDHDVLPKLWNFYRKFEYFILRYATSASRGLSAVTTNTPPLSAAEETRFKRAFFRCEIYTCLSQLSQVTLQRDRGLGPSRSPAQQFLRTLPPSEIEQVYCVLQCYRTIVESIFDKMEDDFVSAVREKQEAYCPAESKRRWQGPVDRFLEYENIEWYEDSLRSLNRATHNDYLVSRGMRAMWKLVHHPYTTVRMMIIDTLWTADRHASIVFIVRQLEFHEGHSPHTGSDPLDSTFAWSWSKPKYRSWIPIGLIGLPENRELRNHGYVFWDQSRLEQIRCFQAARGIVESPYEGDKSYTEYEGRPGVAARLLDLTVDEPVVRMIADEIRGKVQPNDNTADNEDGDSAPYAIRWRDSL